LQREAVREEVDRNVTTAVNSGILLAIATVLEVKNATAAMRKGMLPEIALKETERLTWNATNVMKWVILLKNAKVSVFLI
jgi:hypothetical protein